MTLAETNQTISQNITLGGSAGTADLIVTIDGLELEISEERDARIAADEVLARRIITVSAIAGLSEGVTVSSSAPGSPSVNDYWVDTTDALNPVTYQWSGATWDEVTEPISIAAVRDERTARITADGHLEGKYTLTVTADDVVTGMNITSASGPGGTVSEVAFLADKFRIWNGTSSEPVFDLDGSTIKLNADVEIGGTLTLSQISDAGALAAKDQAAYATDVTGTPANLIEINFLEGLKLAVIEDGAHGWGYLERQHLRAARRFHHFQHEPAVG